MPRAREARLEIVRFPEGFHWGTATSAHQVEGGNAASDWWVWEQQPGRIKSGDRSGLACDWWRHAERDFDLMVGLHQNAARLSVEWARLEPAQDRWDDGALDRYLQMLRGLRDRGLAPMVTLNHFTLPQWVADRDGWTWTGIVPAFAAFCRRVVQAAAPLVETWITLNEPVGYLISGYLQGEFPPGRTSPAALVRALVNTLRAHAASYRIIHEFRPDAAVGVAAHLRPVQPARPGKWLDEWLAARVDHLLNWTYLDALQTGTLIGPGGIRLRIPEAARTMEFVGVNYYTRTLLQFDLRHPRMLFARPAEPPFDAEVSDGNYGEVFPDGLRIVLQQARAYGLPIYITENGVPDADDDVRPRFIVEHLRRVGDAIAAGIPVKGYYHWSLVDNFEWADGWSLRFGLYAMDHTTQVRTPRPSAGLYGEICRTNALPPCVRDAQ